MITVKFEMSEDGDSLILDIKGHANHSEYGKDIVCSASSILAYTVAQVVTDMYKTKKLRKKPTVKLKNGDATIVCKPKKDYLSEAIHTFYVARTGYRLLAHNYPDYVQLEPIVKDK